MEGIYGDQYTSAVDQSLLKKNSLDYARAHEAGDAEWMEALHADSERIRAKYGYSGGADGSQVIRLGQQSSSGYTGTQSQEQMIKDMYAARADEAVAAYTKAYQNSLAELARAEQAIAPKYQDARNLSAGASEQEKRAFAEYAAAYGLNSGTGGQAELARNNALQGSMGQINRGEADAYADIATQRAKLANDYQFSVAQAKAQGDFELAQSLYNEYVRQDNAMRDWQKWQADEEWRKEGWEYSKSRDMVSDARYDNELAYSRSRDAQKEEEQLRMELAQYGIFPMYGKAGVSAADMAQMQKVWEKMWGT